MKKFRVTFSSEGTKTSIVTFHPCSRIESGKEKGPLTNEMQTRKERKF